MAVAGGALTLGASGDSSVPGVSDVSVAGVKARRSPALVLAVMFVAVALERLP